MDHLFNISATTRKVVDVVSKEFDLDANIEPYDDDLTIARLALRSRSSVEVDIINCCIKFRLPLQPGGRQGVHYPYADFIEGLEKQFEPIFIMRIQGGHVSTRSYEFILDLSDISDEESVVNESVRLLRKFFTVVEYDTMKK